MKPLSIDRLQVIQKELIQILERVLPWPALATGIAASLLSPTPLLCFLLVIGYIVGNVSASRLIRRGVGQVSLYKLEMIKYTYAIGYIGAAQYYLGPATPFWLIHAVYLFRVLVVFYVASQRLLLSLGLGATTVAVLLIAGASVNQTVLAALVLLTIAMPVNALLQYLYSHIGQLLARQDGHLHGIMRRVPVAMAHLDRNLRYRYCNAGYSSLVGRPIAEIERARLVEVLGEKMLEQIEPHLEEVFAGKEVHFDKRVSRSGSEERELAVCYTPEISHDGAVVGFYMVAVDVTSLKEAKRHAGEVAQLNEELRGLNDRFLAVQEEERRYLSREIHDEFGQLLMVMNLDLYHLKKNNNDPGLVAKIDTLIDRLADTVKAARQIAFNLRPKAIDHLGLGAAIQDHLTSFSDHTGVDCRFTLDGEAMDLPGEHATHFFRLYQEAITNIQRHSGADEVDVTLRIRPEEMRLSVRDNGRGIARDSSASPTLGLVGMRERMVSLQGSVSIEPVEDGQGTLVEAVAPLGCPLNRSES